MKVIYISGAYRSKWGLLGVSVNIWKARRAAQRIWKDGDIALCPHMNTAFFKEDSAYIRGDCEFVKRSDAIFMLRNWQNSSGASIEFQVARDNRLEIIFEE